MLVSVDHLPRQGRSFAVSSETPWAVAGATTALDAAPRAIAGELHLNQEKGGVRVTGRLDVAAQTVCARCGDAVPFSVHSEPDLLYRPTGESFDEDTEVNEAELDVGWYEVGEEGGQIDLEQVVCEAVSLEIPPKIVCEDSNACDARVSAWKEGEAQSDVVGNPFSVLKNLRS